MRECEPALSRRERVAEGRVRAGVDNLVEASPHPALRAALSRRERVS
jgi:hypothetical protein